MRQATAGQAKSRSQLKVTGIIDSGLEEIR